MNPEISGSTSTEYQELLSWFRPFGRAVVAFSGGVDSTLVLKAACDALSAARVLAVTADSASLARSELETTKTLASELGVKHVVLPTDELENPRYRANEGNRCYFCKSSLYQSLIVYLTQHFGTARDTTVLVDGTNFDDLSDIRPGQKAAAEAGVRHPLVESRFSKSMVRDVSRTLGLPTWRKQEMACLASRIPAGIEVTEQKLRMIEAAEEALRRDGFSQFRVRYHELGSIRDRKPGSTPLTLARIEVGRLDFERACNAELRSNLSAAARHAGFDFVTLDLEGYRKGGAIKDNTGIEAAIEVTRRNTTEHEGS